VPSTLSLKVVVDKIKADEEWLCLGSHRCQYARISYLMDL